MRPHILCSSENCQDLELACSQVWKKKFPTANPGNRLKYGYPAHSGKATNRITSRVLWVSSVRNKNAD